MPGTVLWALQGLNEGLELVVSAQVISSYDYYYLPTWVVSCTGQRDLECGGDCKNTGNV